MSWRSTISRGQRGNGNPAFAGQWDERDTSEVYRDYVDAVIDLAGSGMVDVLAHLDVIKVAGYRPPDLEAHEDRLADALAGAGVAVEVSSAGLRKPCEEIYPPPRLLGLLAEPGVGFTMASDAHEADRIGERHDVLPQALDQAGVTDLVTFDRRRAIPVPRRSTQS